MKEEETEIEKFITEACKNGYFLLRNDEDFVEVKKEMEKDHILILSFHKPTRKLYKYNSKKPPKFIVKGREM